ncbi:Aftiphilin [Taenia crassiceps]|uniref:Aftiphilin n=1 Tax=Taenia crassiceps TaxID=6207 RepID=A0ABR4QN58_9CEST
MNGFNALNSSRILTASNGGSWKTFNELNSPIGQSLSNSDFEMSHEFNPGTTVRGRASDIVCVISNSSLAWDALNIADANGFTLGDKEEVPKKAGRSFSRVALANAWRSVDTLFNKADRQRDACKRASLALNHLKSPKPSNSVSCLLDASSITSDRSGSPHEPLKFVDNSQSVNFINSISVVDNDSADLLGPDHIPLKDPECYSNSSGESEEFDDFAAFQSAEPEHDSVGDFGPSQNVSEECSDFSDFRATSYPEKNVLCACSLVKNLLVHTQTALEVAFSIDKEAGLNTFVPSEILSPNAVSAFRARLLELWERASSEAVRSLLSSASSHPESFASRHVWNSSHTYSMFLGTIGVDLQSTIEDYPFCLPNHGRLKLLEPTPIGNSAVAPANLSLTHLLPSANDTAATDPAPQIPVPEFDWSATGLTNPLSPDGITHSASEADLELFEEMPSAVTSKPPAPISDLEAEFLHPVAPPPQASLAQTLPSPAQSFDAYIDKAKTAAATKKAEVPECVAKVLELLPDFSYLRKSILAFPVLDQTD